MMKLKCSSEVLLFTLWLAPALVFAQAPAPASGSGVARAPYSDPVDLAKQLFVAARYAEAITALKAEYAAIPRPKLLYNIAICYEKLHEPFESLTYFRLYQAEATGLSVDQQRNLIDQINKLRLQLTANKAAAASAPSNLAAGLPISKETKPSQSSSIAAAPRPPIGLENAPIQTGIPGDYPVQLEDADQKEAADRIVAARDLYAAGRYQEAIVELKVSCAITPRPRLYFNIGMCYMKLNQAAKAINFFQRYLSLAPDVTPEKATEVHGYIEQLRTAPPPTSGQVPSAPAVIEPEPWPGILHPDKPSRHVPIYKRGWFWAVTIGSMAIIATAIAVPAALAQKAPLCNNVDICATADLVH